MQKEEPDFESMTRSELISTCKTFWSMIQKLEARVDELERRLNRNSRNSSTPPSLDTPFSDSNQTTKPKKPKKKGPPFGHTGVTRIRFESVDEVLDLNPPNCSCGKSLENIEGTLKKSHQVAELFKPVKVTEYRQYQKQCSGCGRINQAAWPQNVLPTQSIGPHLQSWLCYLHTWCNLSYQKIELLSEELLGFPLSQGTLTNLLNRAHKSLKPGYIQLQEEIQKALENNCDETGWKLAGIRHWLWCAVSDNHSFYWIDKHRSRVALEKGIGENYQGACHSDFFSVYDNQVGQACLSHLQRDLEACLESNDEVDQDFAFVLRFHLNLLWDCWRDQSKKLYSPQDFQYFAEQVKEHLRQWENTLPDGLPKRSGRLRKRLLKYWDKIFFFVKHPETSPDNNIAERAVRPFVTNRKVSGGNRSEWGMEMKSELFSIIGTCRKQGKDAIAFIRDALLATAHPSLTYPLLIEGG